MMKFFSFLFLFVALSLQAQVADFNLQLVSNLKYDQELNDVWGYVDENGTEYALVGMQQGFSIVSLANPNQPVEVFRVPGFGSTWRDIKTHGDYAYVTCESPTRLLIVNMSPLPESNSLPYIYWESTDTMTFSTAHNLYIDNGIAYIFGANYGNSGAIMLDLTQDPMDPTPVGIYDVEYLHDGVVRNDTLWGSAVYEGNIHVIDVKDKANPELLSVWKTPSAFTHNAWISDDGKHLFTTDEVRNAGIGSYDVENIYNPEELDVWYPNDTGIIPHNTHFINDYLVTSHYTIGLSILDVSRPANMIEIGRFDSSPSYRYEGFHGCWGAYPWLPSGLIIATDIEEGLYVFDPEYTRACYLEGTVTHERTGVPIFYPTIEILGTDVETTGNILGEYKTGIVEDGRYTVRVSKVGFFPKTVEVNLQNGFVKKLDVELNDWPTSVSDQELVDGIVVSPVPAQDVLSIQSHAQIANATMFDLSGRVVRRFADTYSNTLTIPVSDLQRGTYVLDVNGGALRQMVVLD